MKFKFIDLFAGIGGFRVALEQLGGECIAFSEIEKNAIEVYQNNYNTDQESNLGDITEVDELPEHDFLVGGVPCQSWSIAGRNKGLNDERGQLWNDVIRLVDKGLPNAFIFENVKGLADPRHKDCLEPIMDAFRSAGYVVEYKLLNAYDFGVSQNRDRVFVVGLRSDLLKKEFTWPPPVRVHSRLYEILDGLDVPGDKEEFVPIKRDLFGERVNAGFNKLTPRDQKNPFFVLTDIRNGPTSVHSWDFKKTTKREKDICMVILRNRRKPQYGPCDGNPMKFEDLKGLIPDLNMEELQKLIDKNILRQYEEDGRYEFHNRRLSGGIDGVYRIYLPECTFFSTLTATGTKDVVATNSVKAKTDEEYKSKFISQILIPKKYREITAEEAVVLQGFPKSFIPHPSPSQTKRLLGNAVCPTVVKVLASEIIKTGVLESTLEPVV
jgi:DNA (cytosine-5)-methyltransferase 1